MSWECLRLYSSGFCWMNEAPSLTRCQHLSQVSADVLCLHYMFFRRSKLCWLLIGIRAAIFHYVCMWCFFIADICQIIRKYFLVVLLQAPGWLELLNFNKESIVLPLSHSLRDYTRNTLPDYLECLSQVSLSSLVNVTL
jgi:hypothetical protein